MQVNTSISEKQLLSKALITGLYWAGWGLVGITFLGLFVGLRYAYSSRNPWTFTITQIVGLIQGFLTALVLFVVSAIIWELRKITQTQNPDQPQQPPATDKQD